MSQQMNSPLFIASITILSLFHATTSQTVTCSQNNTTCSCPFNQTFSGQTCILNCNTEDSCKAKTLYCRPNDPCQVQCTAKSSCSHLLNILAGNSTDLTVICNGQDTCKSTISIQCGTKDCLLSCNGESSCQHLSQNTSIDTTKSTSFQCIGECPLNIQSLQFSQAPTITASNSPTTPTTNPTQNPSTFAPSRSPLAQGQTYSPTLTPTIRLEAVITDFPTINPTPSPTKNPGQVADIDLFEDKVGTEFNIHPLYYVIVGLLVLIIIVCCALFCWVYSSHNRTQKLIAAQQRRIDSRSFNIYTSDGRDGFHGHLHLPSTRMSMNGELIRTDSNYNHKITLEKSKSPSVDVRDTNDIDMRSPTTTNITRHESAAPRVYRLQSTEAVNLIPENAAKLSTANTNPNLPKFDEKQQQRKELSMSRSESLISDELKETWEIEFDDKMEEKDGEETTTGQESGDLFELMTQLVKLPEKNDINKNHASTASLPGHHLLYHHPLYHQPWNIPKAPVMKQFKTKSHNAVDINGGNNNEQSYTNTMYTNIPPPPPTNDIPPPPPPMKSSAFSRSRNRNVNRNKKQLRHNSVQSMQLSHHGALPMHQMSRSWNENMADYHYTNGIFYGYAAALQQIQSLQHHNSLQLNNSNFVMPQYAKQRTHSRTNTNTRTNHGKYLVPHNNENSKTDTQQTVISDLSKHSANETMILHINTSDMDSGEEDEVDDNVNENLNENMNEDENENINDEEVLDKDREDSQSDNTKTMSSNVHGLMPYIRSHAVVDISPMSVDSSHIIENKSDNGGVMNRILTENENLNCAGSMSDDYDTHTAGTTTYKSSFDGTPQSPQLLIQITPEVTVSHHDNDNKDDDDDMDNGEDKSVIINDKEEHVIKLNVSQPIMDVKKIKNVVNNHIAALPENDEIGDDTKQNIDEEEVKVEDVMNEENAKRIEIDIPKEDSKTFKSFTLEKDEQMSECSATPIPKECTYSQTDKNENSQTYNKSKDIGTGFGLQLVGNKEEPTLTTSVHSNSTVIEDTYLKYLNM